MEPANGFHYPGQVVSNLPDRRLRRTGIITDYCEVVDIVDSGSVESKKYDIKKPDIVKSQNFDYVVIAVGKPDVKESIYNDLIGWNIPKEKIVKA